MSSLPESPLESSSVYELDSDRDVPLKDSVESSVSEQVSTGLRVVSLDSDSDSDYLESEDPNSLDLASRGNMVDDDFEWEEVVGNGNGNDNVFEEVTVLSSDYFTDEEEEEPEIGRGVGGGSLSVRELEWEFLITVNNMSQNLFFSSDFMYDRDDSFYVEDESSDVLFDQFIENAAEIRGSPPAAKEVVENLPLVVVEEGDSAFSGGDCAVCKDKVGVGARVRRLPCLHYYHEECIMPWLGMRNTCPVCRYELPTDDVEYERSKTGRGRGRTVSWDLSVNEEFELFA